jgi:hypothetical protein
MAAQYSKYSPYYDTKTFGPFLDVLNYRNITKNPLDIRHTIGPVYKFRPDLLASDLYGSSALWWVFAARNPNVIKDPIFDFFPGQVIYIPSKDNLKIDLGL